MSKVNENHADYNKYLPIWQKCRDTFEGQEAVHARGETYLPRLTGQSNIDYEKYKGRALFFNAVGRTVEGMDGMVFRKQPMLEYPTAMQSIVDDIDMQGTKLIDFADELVRELLVVNRGGILVDFPRSNLIGLTQLDLERSGIRPYAVLYKAESIIDWKYKRVNNRNMLVNVKLLETVEYEGKQIAQIRELELTDEGYTVELYRETNGGFDDEPDERFIPLLNNSPMYEIPFVFDKDVHKPVILDLVNVNLSHYKSTADYEHGLHFTGLPTAIFWGIQSDGNEQAITIGSESALAFANPEGHAEYLEFTGQGLGALRDALSDKKDMMASLGMKALGAEKRAVETAEAVSIKQSAETSVLASIANRASSMLNKTLQYIAMWQRITAPLSITLNTDYAPAGISPQLFAELTKAYLSGTMSYETYFWNLKNGEIVENDRSMDDELASIQENNLTNALNVG